MYPPRSRSETESVTLRQPLRATIDGSEVNKEEYRERIKLASSPSTRNDKNIYHLQGGWRVGYGSY